MIQRTFLVQALPTLLLAVSVNAQTLIFQTGDGTSASPSVPVGQQSAPLPAPPVSSSPALAGTDSSPVVTSGASELFFMVEQLQQEVRELRGIVEEQGYIISQMQDRSKDRYRDLDSRILDLSQKFANNPAAASVVSPGPATLAPSAPNPSAVVDKIIPAGKVTPAKATTVPPTEEQKAAYRAAYDLIKEKKFQSAVDKFHEFIETYPEGELTGNAYYWLGEVYLVLPKLEQAEQAFKYVVAAFPGHRKEADALYKLGVTLHKKGDSNAAQPYFDLVMQKFPDSSAARLAAEYKSKL